MARERKNGGGSGIRTHETLTSLHAFQASAFNHSAIPPQIARNDAHYTHHGIVRNDLTTEVETKLRMTF